MEIWSGIGKLPGPGVRNEIDLKEMATDLRTNSGRSVIAYRTKIRFW